MVDEVQDDTADEEEVTPEEASLLAGKRMTWQPSDVVIEEPDDE